MPEYYNSPRWTQEIMDCAFPMTFDTYSNCAFNCLYCFSQYQRGISAPLAYFLKKCKFVNPEKIKKMFLSPDEFGGQFKDYIKKGIAFQWGGLSDQFDEFEKKYKKTLELMKFFREIEYPISFSTKAVDWLEDAEYIEIIKGFNKWHYKISIISDNEDKVKEVERGCPSSEKRLNIIEKLSKLGLFATLRLRPFIIGISNPTHKELIKKAVDKGAKSVSLEFFCLENRANTLTKIKYKLISRICGYDILKFYRENSLSSGYLRLNRQIKKRFVEDMQEICELLKIPLHISDAHFKELGANGCCCGASDDFPYFKGQLTECLTKAFKDKKEFSFNDLDQEHFCMFNNFKWGDACGFNTGTTLARVKRNNWSMGDYVHNCWNDWKSMKSPYGYTGKFLKICGVNDNKDIVYGFHNPDSNTIKK